LGGSENARLLHEVSRVLRPGGSWIITTPNYRSLWPLLEVALNVWSPVKYNEQHLTRFHKKTLRQHLENSGWEVEEFRTFFIFSPFFAWISRGVAKRLHSLEKAFKLPGSLLIVRAKKPMERSQERNRGHVET
jgi:SAM-dependent methyltransferase